MRLQVQQIDSLILVIDARRHSVIGREGHGGNSLLADREPKDFFARGRVPERDGLVARGEESLAIRGEGERSQPATFIQRHGKLFVAGFRTQQDRLGRLVLAVGSAGLQHHDFAIRRETESDAVPVADRKLAQPFAGGPIPEDHVLPAGRGQNLAVGRKGESADFHGAMLNANAAQAGDGSRRQRIAEQVRPSLATVFGRAAERREGEDREGRD